MDQQSRSVRRALAGAAAALSILSALLLAACAAKQPYEFPAMRLTTPTASEAETRH
jgi:hypothetical protein